LEWIGPPVWLARQPGPSIARFEPKSGAVERRRETTADPTATAAPSFEGRAAGRRLAAKRRAREPASASLTPVLGAGMLKRIGSARVGSLISVAVLAAVVVTAAAAPVGISDSTTVIGDTTLAANNGVIDLLGQNIPVFQGDASSSSYVTSSPVTGTIVSWSFRSGGATKGDRFVLRVLSPVDTSGQTWRAISTSDPEAVTSATGTDAVQGPFTVSIPITPGERIALEPIDEGYTPIETGVNGKDGIRYFVRPFADGSSSTIPSGASSDNGQIVPIQATVDFVPPPLANTTPPAISGTPSPGDSLSCSNGTWAQTPTAYTYQWLRDGQPVSGATNAVYPVTSADSGHTLSCTVSATVGITAAGTATSAPVTVAALSSGTTTTTPSGGSATPPTGTVDDHVTVNGKTFHGGTINYGSTVDVTHGGVTLTTPNGTVNLTGNDKIPSAFVLTRATIGGKRVTLFRLAKGNFAVCPKRKTAGVAGPPASTRVVRELWGNGKGSFQTRGRYAAATVRGTHWLTVDRCDGTLVKVARGVVQVTNVATHRIVTVRAGQSYLAKA
jgi:hypothetical protein